MRASSLTGAIIAALCGTALLIGAASAALAETPVQRGAYLVTSIGACGNCHTPRDATMKPVAALALAGGFAFEDPGIGHVAVPEHHARQGHRHRQFDRRADRR